MGEGVALSDEDLGALSGPSAPPLRILSLQSSQPMTHQGTPASESWSNEVLSDLIRSRMVLADDALLDAYAQLADPRRINVHLSREIKLSSVKALLNAHPNLSSDFCLPGLQLFEAGREDPSICLVCLVRDDDYVLCGDCSHEPMSWNIDQDLLDLFEWPQARQQGYCSSCFLPLRLCEVANREASEADTCIYRSVMQALLAFYSPQMEGWRKLTADGDPTYWSVI
jgi:hypothetical protein